MDDESENSHQYFNEAISETDPDESVASQNLHQGTLTTPLEPQTNPGGLQSPSVTPAHSSSSPASPQLTTVNSPSTPEDPKFITVTSPNTPQSTQVPPVTSLNTLQCPQDSTVVSSSHASTQSVAVDFPESELPSNNDVPTVPPPSYWSVNAANNILEGPTAENQAQNGPTLTFAPPPSYDSLFNVEENNNSESVSSQGHAARNLEQTVAHSNRVSTTAIQVVDEEPSEGQSTTRSPAKTAVLVLLLVVFGTVLPLAMIVVGAKKFNHCRVATSFPPILIASAIFHLLEAVWTYQKYFRKTKSTRNSGCWLLFLCVWIIACSVNIYRIQPQSTHPARTNYCDLILYRFLFYLAIFYDVLLGLAFVFLVCLKYLKRHRWINQTLTRILNCQV